MATYRTLRAGTSHAGYADEADVSTAFAVIRRALLGEKILPDDQAAALAVMNAIGDVLVSAPHMTARIATVALHSLRQQKPPTASAVKSSTRPAA